MKKRRIVEVKWLDSSSRAGGVWKDRDHVESNAPVECLSVGYVVARSKKHIVLAAHLAPAEAGGDMAIPRSAITSMRKLK